MFADRFANRPGCTPRAPNVETMTTVGWRQLLLSLCGLALAVTVCTVLSMLVGAGDAGISVGTSRIPFQPSVVVERGGPAWGAGLRTGDVLDIKDMAPGERYRLLNDAYAGDRLHLSVVTRTGVRHVTLTARNTTDLARWDVWFALAGAFWTILFATVISWKRPDSVEARTLAVMLVAIVIGTTLDAQNWRTPWPLADAIAGALSWILYVAGYTLLATYAMLFARPASRLRRALMWLSYICGGAAALYLASGSIWSWTALIDPSQPALNAPAAQIAANLPYFLFPLLCALATIGQSRGAERTRLLWACVPLCILYVQAIVWVCISPLNVPWAGAIFAAGNLASFLAPLGLTYSLLNRRLLDVGFVLNRAAVYSVVSIVVVGMFMLAEWALSQWMSSASHTTNLAISAALALALGLSVRFVHARVDTLLDTIFFRRRHEDEHAIRTFAHEAAFVTDADTVVQRAIETLERHADASFVTIALDEGTGDYGGVDKNDRAIVALRAWRKPLDLHSVRTEFTGDLAYPMIARGRLVGALVLGPKRSGDTYAPDESDAIALLASSIAGALDVLSMPAPGDELRAIRASLDALNSAITDMPAAIARELRAQPAPATTS